MKLMQSLLYLLVVLGLTVSQGLSRRADPRHPEKQLTRQFHRAGQRNAMVNILKPGDGSSLRRAPGTRAASNLISPEGTRFSICVNLQF